jgi:hypothetical protein
LVWERNFKEILRKIGLPNPEISDNLRGSLQDQTPNGGFHYRIYQ